MVRVCANNLITHARPANQAVIIYVREMYIKNVNGILNLSLKYHANCFVAKMTYLNTALKQFKMNDSHHRWSLAGKGAGDKAYNLNAKIKHNVCLIADTFIFCEVGSWFSKTRKTCMPCSRKLQGHRHNLKVRLAKSRVERATDRCEWQASLCLNMALGSLLKL